MTDEPVLRYADCPTAEALVDIAASTEVVWALVTDIQLPSRFGAEFLGADWADGATEPGIGARFVGRNQHAAIGTWETTSTITALEPLRMFEWTVGDLDHPSSIWRFTLEPSGDGTHLRQWMQMGPARSGINMAIDAMPDKESRILRRRLSELQTNMRATLHGIRSLAER